LYFSAITAMLERLSYTSKETEPFGTRALFDLLNQARQNNAARALTGHLLYAHGVFSQCVEGPTASLNALWDALQKDPRHQDIVLMYRRPIETRHFADWTMAFSSYRYLNTFNMPGFFPIDERGASTLSDLCQS
jgi:hypothetical protein